MKLDKSARKSSNVSSINQKPAEVIRRPGQAKTQRSPKYSRPAPGGVQETESLSKALMGSVQSHKMTEAAARDAIASFKKRNLGGKDNPFKKTIEDMKRNKNGPNPFDKARSK